jgi:hypothetical protein
MAKTPFAVLLLVVLCAAPAFAADAVNVGSTVDWLSIVMAIVAAGFTIYQKALSPKVHAKLEAEAADSHASAFQQHAATFGDRLLLLAEAQAAHLFEAEQKGEATGANAHSALAEATNDMLGGLGDAGKTLAQQYLGVGGAALYDFVEGFIKSQLQQKRNAALAAGAAAAVAAVPAAVPAVAGPAAAAVINTIS